MKENKVSLSGIGSILNAIVNLFTNYFKPQEDMDKIEAETGKAKSETRKIESQMRPEYLRTLAEAENLKLEALEKAVGLYKSIGYTDEEIKGFIGAKTTEVIELYNCTKILLELEEKGVIIHASIKELKEPPQKATE
ncbi:MAG: hypothetical protein KDH95_06205 [Calditrichaeota bacterium]|nr:hypothetical protein [Calditrichota bacterium]MCB0267739.1 hypothetical protein [Calditrichota bacterium]